MEFSNNKKHDVKKLKKITEDWSGLLGLDLASKVSCKKAYRWNSFKTWNQKKGYVKNKKKNIKLLQLIMVSKKIF